MVAANAMQLHEVDRGKSPEMEGVFGFLSEFRKDPVALFQKTFRAHGDFARGRFLHTPAVFAFHPDDVQRVLVDNVGNYGKQTRGYDQLRVLLGNGLVTSQGDFWLRQRRIAQPAFARRRIAGFARTMLDSTEDTLRRWGDLEASGEEIDVSAEMMQLTLRIAGLTMLSRDLEGESADIGQALTDIVEVFNENVASIIPFRRHLPTPRNLKARAASAKLDAVVYDIIERRRAGEGGDDLLQMLVETVDEETGERMNDVQLRDEVMTMFLAGHETTANALTWTFTLLSRHPEVARKVERELDEVLGDGPLDPMRVRELGYLDRVIKESLRLMPPVWALGRRAEEADVLHGERIEPGTIVFLSPYVTHRHPEFWHNPEGFDPDRFLDDVRPRYKYFPFAGGPRQCIGKHFAEMELALIAASVLRRFRIELSPGHPVVPQASVTLRPQFGVKARLSRR
jgi:cytochrome P450